MNRRLAVYELAAQHRLEGPALRRLLARRATGDLLVSDAWFFREDEAQRWAAARFGKFRVDAQGRALLVNLRGADLQPL